MLFNFFVSTGSGTLLSIQGGAQPTADGKIAGKVPPECKAPRGMRLAHSTLQRNEALA
jgi:hypothetical protein